MEMKFYRCEVCGNIIMHLKDSGVRVVCCGQQMKELVPGSVDAATEKHVPVIAQDGSKVVVSVGSVAHPMAEEHYIQFIVLVTKKGYQVAHLMPGSEPKAEFALLPGDAVVEAYEYCNLHGLWRA